MSPFTKIFWGFSDLNGSYYFAMGYGASLMFGWTLLLIWAYCKPLERRFVALFTSLVVIGLVVTEITSIAYGIIKKHNCGCYRRVLREGL